MTPSLGESRMRCRLGCHRRFRSAAWAGVWVAFVVTVALLVWADLPRHHAAALAPLLACAFPLLVALNAGQDPRPERPDYGDVDRLLALKRRGGVHSAGQPAR